MKRHAQITRLSALLVGVAVLAGCGRKQSTEDLLVAKVADRPVSMALYEKAWSTVDAKYLPKTDDLEGRKEFLNTIINKEVLTLKADELGYDKDEYVLKAMEAFKKVGLPAGYLRVKVPPERLEITDEDLREAFPNFGRTLQIKQILVDTKEDADVVEDQLKAGGDFETVCREYSKGPDAEEGGRVVTAVWGQFPPDFNTELFSTQVGDVTDPILSRYGYFIIKVVSGESNSRKTLEQARPDLTKILKQQRQLAETTRMSDAIREKYHFEFYDQNLVTAFDALPPDRPLTNPPNRSDEVYPLLRFDPQDLDKPMVTYNGKTITIKDFSDLYDRASFFQRPRREYRLGDIRKFLVDYVMNELIEVEIETTGLENEPLVADMLRKKREQIMVDKLYQDLVDGQTEISNEELQSYYNDNLEQFRRPEERRFHSVVCGDFNSAKRASEQLRRGRNLEAVRKEFGVGQELLREDVNDRFFAKGQQPEVDDNGFTMQNVGEVSEPFEMSSGWVVIKFVERRPERIMPLAEAQHDIEHYLKTVANERRLNELLDKWKTEYQIEIYEDNLMKATLRRGKGGLEFS